MTRAFLDANIQVYYAGRSHPLKEPCRQVLTLVSDHPETFLTDAEVLQELLHRYRALQMWEPLGKESFYSFAELMEGRTEPVQASDVVRAASLAENFARLEARDLVHLAVMQRLGVTQIVTADAAFDGLPDIERLDPANVANWQERLVGSSTS